MASLLRKAARMNLVAMDFVLQVTVVELVLGTLDSGRMLSFELSRGTKTSGLPPKLVSTTRSEWEQTMQIVLTLFMDRRSGRFQDKEYKLRLVNRENGHSMLEVPSLATFTLDASLYAHLGAGPSVEQPVDLYAPKLTGLGGFATVHLRVRCCEPGESTPLGRSVPPPSVSKQQGCVVGAAPVSGSGLPPRGPLALNRPSLPPLQSGLLVGSSFGFSMSGSESRHSAASTGSSAFSTPVARRPGRPWSNDDLPGSTASTRTRSTMRSKLGSKSFNDLDDSEYTPSSSAATKPGSARGLRSSSMSFHGMLGSNGDSAGGQSPRPDIGRRRPLTRLLTSESSYLGSFATDGDQGDRKTGRSPASALPYDRTATVGYNRLLARFTKGPSPRGRRQRPGLLLADGSERPLPLKSSGSGSSGSASSTMSASRSRSNRGGASAASNNINNKRRIFTFTNGGPAPMASAPASAPEMAAPAAATATTNAATATATAPSFTTTSASSPHLPILKKMLPANHRATAAAAAAAAVPASSSAASLAQQQQRQQRQQPASSDPSRYAARRSPRAGFGRLAPLSLSSMPNATWGWGASRTPRVGPGVGGMQAGLGGAGASTTTTAASRGELGRQQSDDSAGGGSAAVAAPLSAASAGGGVGGGGSRVDQEELQGMENRVLHLEAALLRSELDLCRAKTEVSAARQEVAELKAAKEAEEQGGRSSADISALYHALEGSVVLLQIASEKMLHLEENINKYRAIMPEVVFEELQKCVTQDAVALSPPPSSSSSSLHRQRA